MRVRAADGRLILLAGVLLLAAASALLVGGDALTRETAPPRTASAQTAAIAYRGLGLPFHFEPNVGQSAASAGFIARADSYSVFLDPRGMTIALPTGERNGVSSPWEDLISRARGRRGTSAPSLVRIEFVGSDRRASFEPTNRLDARVNYFIGNDPKRWRTDVPTYGRLRVRDLWPGIEAVFYQQDSQLELDFVAAAGADVSRIRLRVEGRAHTGFDPRGNLILETDSGRFSLMRPRVYQSVAGRRHEIGARYVLSGATRPETQRRRAGNRVEVRIKLAAYDKGNALVIDPRLKYSSFFGGSGNDQGLAVALDESGNVYLAGSASSINLPLRNPADPTCNACGARGSEGFVAKFNPKRSGRNSLVYASYIGGSGNPANHTGDSVAGVAVDSEGNIYLAGTTSSSDFPTTSNALLSSCPTSPLVSPCNTGFVTELNPSATGSAQLVYSTYLGGSGNSTATPATGDGATAIAVLSARTVKVFVTGFTSSTDFPLTQNAFQTACGAAGSGSFGAFITELTPAAAGPDSLSYSTYVCGGTTDIADAIFVAGGAVFIAGGTQSSDFPTTADAYQSSCNACPSAPNAFVAEIVPALGPASQPAYATFFGGSGSTLADGSSIGDIATGVSAGALIALVGMTSSPDLPSLTPPDVSANGFQQSCPSKNLKLADGTPVCRSGFVALLGRNPSQQSSFLDYGSYLGGSGVRRTGTGDFVSGVAVDSLNDIYVTGTATSHDFPTSKGALKRRCPSCGASAFVTKVIPFASDASDSLGYSTLLGGSTHDQGNALTLDATGNAYVAGTTRSGDFPTSANAFARSKSGGADAFVSVIATAPIVVPVPPVLNFGTSASFGNRFETKGPLFVHFKLPAGQVPVQITSLRDVAVMNDASNSFAIAFDACAGGIRPGGDCPVSIVFNPTGLGKHEGTLTMNNNTSAGKTVVSLIGSVVQGKVSIRPLSLSFAPQKIGTPSGPKIVTIANPNGIAMGIASVTPTGDFFVSSNTCSAPTGFPYGVSANSRCSIAVRFKPAAHGKRAGSLALKDEAANGTPPGTQTISLTGVGR